MRIKIIITALFALVVLQLSAQDSYIKNRWNITAAYQTETSENTGNFSRHPFYHLGVNYGVLKHFECGANLAFSLSDFSSNRLQYYANCNFHILPFWVDSDDFRFDLYLISKAGGITFFHSAYSTTDINDNFIDVEAHRTHNLYYGGGAGVAFYPFRHIGVFAEYTYEKFNYTKAMFFQYGLSVKF
jgi:hypothetical protein